MSAKSFGPYRSSTSIGQIGPQGTNRELLTGERTVVFGKRVQPPVQSISLQRERLSHLCSELTVLFEDGAFLEQPLPFELVDTAEDVPRLLVGEGAVVTIDGETGHLIFEERTAESGVVVTTADEERLIDHVVCYLASSGRATGMKTVDEAARTLVGQKLSDVERRIILHTLRHCHGNRTRAAQMLGISLRTVRNKLREYWRTSETAGGRL